MGLRKSPLFFHFFYFAIWIYTAGASIYRLFSIYKIIDQKSIKNNNNKTKKSSEKSSKKISEKKFKKNFRKKVQKKFQKKSSIQARFFLLELFCATFFGPFLFTFCGAFIDLFLKFLRKKIISKKSPNCENDFTYLRNFIVRFLN